MAKGKSSNIADKIKWLLSIRCLFCGYSWKQLLHRSCFFIQSPCCCCSFYCCKHHSCNNCIWKRRRFFDEGVKNRNEKSCLAHKDGDYSNFYGSFWFNNCSMFIFLGARVPFKLANKINFRIVLK